MRNKQELKMNLSEATAPVPVDLGLPSGTIWCDRNVGATAPEDAGAFFSWGNTVPCYPRRDIAPWGSIDDAFEISFDENAYEETEGSKLINDIDLAHDAARANMGGSWQMPSVEQFKELCKYCKWELAQVNGVNGYRVTSEINGASLFFPCSGDGYGTTWVFRGSYGGYWSSTFSSGRGARLLYFYSGGVSPQDLSYRYYGFPVRPVQNHPARK